jgi:hypothetical protein
MRVWLWALAVSTLATTASADGLVPRGFTFTYRTLADTSVTTRLVFDAEPSNVEVGVADTSFTIEGVIRAVWETGPDAGLEWFFTDGDTLVATSDLLIHGFRRPGLGIVFFAPGTGPPMETFPQVWVPATVADGATWSWTGLGLCGDYAQERTESYQAQTDTVQIPYRGEWICPRIQVTEPVICEFRLPDGRGLDAFGRVVEGIAAGKIGEPRWVTGVSTGAQDRWAILLKDAFVELVDVEIDGDPIVPTTASSVSGLKSRFE